MRVYTRTGDAGETSLFDGTRVAKDDGRVAAYGDVDELSAAVGAARARVGIPETAALLAEIQRDLFAIGGQLANPAERSPKKVAKSALGADRVERLERAIDELEGALPPIKRFILPGGSPAAAALHVARAVCRRAERTVVGLARLEPLSPVVLPYLNRLSDYLFTAARAENRRAGMAEVEW